jgi:hypothetical protein
MGGESVKTNSCMGRYLGIYFKGLCHEMNIFFNGLKNQISTFCICADSF